MTAARSPRRSSLDQMMADKSRVLSKAQAFQAMGMPETAEPLWITAAAMEEQIAPRLDALGQELDAAVHRVSAASCYQHAGDAARAANLYRAALAGPLRPETRREVEDMLARCLRRLARRSPLGPDHNPAPRAATG